MPVPRPISADRLRRFEAKYIPEPMSGCWLWTAGANERGYGVFWNGDRLEKAHRFSFRAAGHAIADDADLCHRCDTPACVNPAHLFVGDALQNVTDMWAKRRATVQSRRGTAQVRAKLTDEKAAYIRRVYAAKRPRQRDLATVFGVSQRVIWNVIHRHSWRNPSGVVIETGRGK